MRSRFVRSTDTSTRTNGLQPRSRQRSFTPPGGCAQYAIARRPPKGARRARRDRGDHLIGDSTSDFRRDTKAQLVRPCRSSLLVASVRRESDGPPSRQSTAGWLTLLYGREEPSGSAVSAVARRRPLRSRWGSRWRSIRLTRRFWLSASPAYGVLGCRCSQQPYERTTLYAHGAYVPKMPQDVARCPQDVLTLRALNGG